MTNISSRSGFEMVGTIDPAYASPSSQGRRTFQIVSQKDCVDGSTLRSHEIGDSVIIIGLGDLMLGEHPLYIGIGANRSWARVGQDPLRWIAREMLAADIVVANLETPLSRNSARKGYQAKVLRGDPDLARSLATTGISVVSVANNHALEHGPTAFEESVHYLEQAGVVCVGTAHQPMRVLDIRGIRVAVAGASLRPEQVYPDQSSYYAPTEAELLRLVEDARNKASAVVLSIHWGDEYSHIPSCRQVDLARQLVSRGVHIIFGHHPHVLQPVHLDSNSVIAFSLGNCVSDMCQMDARISECIRVTCTASGVKHAERRSIRIDESHAPKFVGPWTSLSTSKSSPVILDGVEYDRLVESSLKRFRREFGHFFLRNWHRYPAYALVSVLAGAIRRRWLRLLAKGLFVKRRGSVDSTR